MRIASIVMVTSATVALIAAAAGPAAAQQGAAGTGGPAPAHAAEPAAEAAQPADCVDWVFTTDGLRIHTNATLGSSVAGLAYDGDHAEVYTMGTEWDHVRDTRTNVSGWVVAGHIANDATCTQ